MPIQTRIPLGSRSCLENPQLQRSVPRQLSDSHRGPPYLLLPSPKMLDCFKHPRLRLSGQPALPLAASAPQLCSDQPHSSSPPAAGFLVQMRSDNKTNPQALDLGLRYSRRAYSDNRNLPHNRPHHYFNLRQPRVCLVQERAPLGGHRLVPVWSNLCL